MSETQIFLALKDYPKSTKNEIRNNLRNEGYTKIGYSGKERGFYAQPPITT